MQAFSGARSLRSSYANGDRIWQRRVGVLSGHTLCSLGSFPSHTWHHAGTYFYMSRFKLCLPWLGLTQAFVLVSIPRPIVSCQEAANTVSQKYINILLKSSFLWNCPPLVYLGGCPEFHYHLLGWDVQIWHPHFFFFLKTINCQFLTDWGSGYAIKQSWTLQTLYSSCLWAALRGCAHVCV